MTPERLQEIREALNEPAHVRDTEEVAIAELLVEIDRLNKEFNILGDAYDCLDARWHRLEVRHEALLATAKEMRSHLDLLGNWDEVIATCERKP